MVLPEGRTESTRWLWDAFKNLDEDVIVSRLVPSEWDWNQVHHQYGTPLMAMVEEGIRLGENNDHNRPFWRLLRYCLGQGSDPRTEVRNVTGTVCGWGGTELFPKLPLVKCEGHSGISLVYAVQARLKEHAKQYDAQLKNTRTMLKIFADFVPQGKVKKVSVHEKVVDTWEAFMNDERFGDIELDVIAPKACNSGKIKANSGLLRTVSFVLDATLSSPMRERETGIIKVEGVSVEAVRLFLYLVHTGTTTAELEPTLLLDCLDIAHRWQVNHVVDMVENALIGLVNARILLPCFEAALRKDLPALRIACKSFAAQAGKDATALERKLEDLQASVSSLAHGTPDKKRQRRSL